MKYFFKLILLLFILSISIFGQRTRPKETDNQFWNETQLVFPLSKRLNFSINGVLRFGRNARHFADERIGFAFSYKFNNWFSTAAGYLYRATQPDAVRRNYEHRPFFGGTLTIPLGSKFTLIDRNNLEFRLRNSQSNQTVFRTRARLERPVKIKKFAMTPFIANEIFYRFEDKNWFRNRFSVGINKKLTKKLTGEIYYLRQNDATTAPGDLHVLGTGLNYRF